MKRKSLLLVFLLLVGSCNAGCDIMPTNESRFLLSRGTVAAIGTGAAALTGAIVLIEYKIRKELKKKIATLEKKLEEVKGAQERKKLETELGKAKNKFDESYSFKHSGVYTSIAFLGFTSVVSIGCFLYLYAAWLPKKTRQHLYKLHKELVRFIPDASGLTEKGEALKGQFEQLKKGAGLSKEAFSKELEELKALWGQVAVSRKVIKEEVSSLKKDEKNLRCGAKIEVSKLTAAIGDLAADDTIAWRLNRKITIEKEVGSGREVSRSHVDELICTKEDGSKKEHPSFEWGHLFHGFEWKLVESFDSYQNI